MNKYKKIAAAVVSTVMAGTMVLSLAACNNDKPDTPDGPTGGGSKETDILKLPDLYNVVDDETGYLNYDAYNRANPVNLGLAVGHNSAQTSTHFQSDLGTTITLPDGKNYTNGNTKAAWAAMGKELNISWTDRYTGKGTGANLDTISAVGGGYENIDMFTTDLSKAVEKASDVSILNLANYLDYMPNFTKFLNDNPVVYLSLLQAGMNTSNGSGKVLYVAPYFDGNDDIERYCIIRQDWAAKLLNGDTASTSTTTYATECGGTSTSVAAFMGNENYTIESLNSTGTAKQNITKNYAAVVEALKATGTNALKTAYNAIDSNGYSGTSGNIVDVMNAAINASSGAATGPQLLNLFRAYIDVCYGSVYTPATRANLFNGYDAAWDVDDLVAMLRVVKTNASYVAANKGGEGAEGQRNVLGIAPRENNIDRTPDMVRLACQLYGVRGADSRYENTYIDGNGVLQDARLDKDFYAALDRLHTLRSENLITDYSNVTTSLKTGLSKDAEAFFMYDYNQTQTAQNFYAEDTEGKINGDNNATPNGYKFAPIMTPVSRWDTDGNTENGHETTMRFTESWRSTKTGGLALNGALANNPDKLKAALQFVDYLYSEDGQIISTFGPQAEDAAGTNGFWYNEPLANQNETDKTKYFTYKGTKYSGYAYKGTTHPTITTAVYDSFTFNTVKGYNISSLPSDKKMSVNLSFTDYARKLIGSTLPVGVKDQAFEDQLTSATGREGAKKVGVALSEQFQTIKGMTLKLDVDNLWYTCVPTGLPFSSMQSGQLKDTTQDAVQYMTGKQDSAQDKPKNFHTIFNYIILNGATGTYDRGQGLDVTYTFASENPIDKLVEDMGKAVSAGGLGANVRETLSNTAWNTAKNYWNYLKPSDEE